jgi:hypothetical protein
MWHHRIAARVCGAAHLSRTEALDNLIVVIVQISFAYHAKFDMCLIARSGSGADAPIPVRRKSEKGISRDATHQ